MRMKHPRIMKINRATCLFLQLSIKFLLCIDIHLEKDCSGIHQPFKIPAYDNSHSLSFSNVQFISRGKEIQKTRAYAMYYAQLLPDGESVLNRILN